MLRYRVWAVLGLSGWLLGAAADHSLAADTPSKHILMVPMRDGTRLATEVYRPAGRGPWSAALVRTPYNRRGSKDDQIGPWPTRFVENGIVLVSQDIRGTGDSEGRWRLGVDDAWGKLQDGADTVAWIRRQPWCNGKVATVGMPIPQTLLAGTGPQGIVGQHANIAPLSVYHHAIFQNGVFRPVWEKLVRENEWPLEILHTWREHPSYDDYWRGLDLGTRLQRVRWPVVIQTGWYQNFCQGAIDGFVRVREDGGPGARGRAHLTIGPWPLNPKTRQLGDLTFPENAVRPPGAPDWMDWLRFWLKGESTVRADEPVVRYYVMGDVDDLRAPGNTWRVADRWPPPSRPLRLYFTAGGGLSPERPEQTSPGRYGYNPLQPVPTLGGPEWDSDLKPGPRDQRPLEERSDVLLYTSAPLEQPLEVTGRLRVRLFAASSARDTDFTAKLCDVYSDGRSMLVSDGIVRARYRRSLEKPEPIVPGRRYAYEIDLWSTSLVFNRGHRIRVSISSSNAPRFEPNPNTWPDNGDNKAVMAHQTIFLGGRAASHIVLPEVTAGRLQRAEQ